MALLRNLPRSRPYHSLAMSTTRRVPAFVHSALNRWLRLAIVIVAAIVLGPLTPRAALAQALTPSQKAQLLEKAEQIVRERAFASGVDFDKRWPELLEKYKARIDGAEDAGALSRVLNRALGELGISHIEFLTPRAAESTRRSSMVGIGIVSQPSNDGVRIAGLVDDAPAKKAGLKVGDLILEVDGKALDNVEQIRGPEGSTVSLKVRSEEGDERVVELKRARFSTREPATLETLADDAFVLTLPTFSTGYNRDEVEKLIGRARKAPYLILDLRNNGGGDFSNMIHFLSCFLPAGTQIGTQVGRNMSARYAEETGGDPADAVAVAAWSQRKDRIRRNATEPFKGKMAVLINRASASASEIVAAALSEIRSAPLVGSRTAGAVLVSTYMPAGDGFQMKVPISEWVTIKGRRLEGNPLVADIAVESRRGMASDEAAKVALERLRTME